MILLIYWTVSLDVFMMSVYIPCSFICVLGRLLAFLAVLFGR